MKKPNIRRFDGKVSYSKLYLFCLTLWSFFYTLDKESYLELPWLVYGTVAVLIRLFILAKLLHDAGKTRRTLIAFLVIILGETSHILTENQFLLFFCWFAAGSYRVKIRDIVKAMFAAQLAAFLVVTVLSAAGLITNYTVTRATSYALRYSMGFMHPNMFGQKVFQLWMMGIYLLGDRVRLWHCLLMLVTGTAVMLIADSRACVVMLLSASLLVVAYLISESRSRLLSKLSGWGIGLMKYSVIAAALLSAALAFGTNISVGRFLNTEDTLVSRISQMRSYLGVYNITPFGTKLYYWDDQSMVDYYNSTLYTLDNSYLYLLLGLGVVITVLFIAAYILTLRKAVKEKDRLAAIILACYAMYGLVETTMIRFSLNFSLVFVFALLWGTPIRQSSRRVRIVSVEQVSEDEA